MPPTASCCFYVPSAAERNLSPGGGGGGGGGHSVGFHTGVCSSGVRTLTLFCWGGGGGGALGQVSYWGVQLRGPNPYPILGKAGLRKHTLF